LQIAFAARKTSIRGRSPMLTAWVYLGLAIASEVVATLQLRELSDGFRWVPAVIVVVGYAASFALMVPALKTINVGVSYAIWSAVGTTAVAVLGVIFYNEHLNALGIGGIVLILGGVVMLSASGSTTH
jgi:small multidrug resistance pump